MTRYRLAFLGFGNVGKALAKLLLEKQSELSNRYDIQFEVTGIATGRHGSVISDRGIDLLDALQLLESEPLANLANLSGVSILKNNDDFIRICKADVLFENTPVNYENGQPAVEYIEMALSRGMHVITANKGPVVHAHARLVEIANQHGKKFYFESAVMDGAPIFSLFRSTLPAAQLRSFRGILNSTTNMILSLMEKGKSFDEAVFTAQEIGIAETDPSGDIDGWDAAVKVAALVTVIMGFSLKPNQVFRQGIRELTAKDIQVAVNQGKRWKLICSAERDVEGVKAIVKPELVEQTSPFYFAEGTTSIIQFQTDVLGLLSIVEENPGPHTTAYGCLADFINAVVSR